MDRRYSDVQQKYLAKLSKSPSPGSEKIPCKYSARSAKSQPRFSHSTDQGKIAKQVLSHGNCFVIHKLKARDEECKNEQSHCSRGEEGLRQRSGRGNQKTIQGDGEFDGEDK